MSKSSADVKAREKGFTLVELMVVLGVIVLLVGLAVPGYEAFAAKARVAKAATAAGCLRAGLTGVSDWSPERQQAVFNHLGGSTADFFETSQDLGCNIGPTIAHSTVKPSLSTVRFCLVEILHADGSITRIGCLEFSWSMVQPGDEVKGYEMSFGVPKAANAVIGLTSQGVTIEDSSRPSGL
jgi:prepilin-type N-terminal cleavage/methylation domain-containing protein